MKIHLLILSMAILLFMPVVSHAQSPVGINEGSVIQAKRAAQKYLFVGGKKRLIKNNFTLRQLGVRPREVMRLTKAEVAAIAEAEPLGLSSSRVDEKYDMHEHFQAGGDMNLYLSIARQLGIAKTVFVPTGAGPDNRGFKENMAALLAEQAKNPEKIIAFCTVDEAVPEASEIFSDCLDRGGQGLKLMVGHPNFYDVPINSDEMKELFEIARTRDVPVLIHVSIINIPTAKAELMSLLDDFPDVRVQFAHYCSAIMNGVNLGQCGEFLDKYPNLIIDISMGGGIERYFKFMTRDIAPIKDFILKYQDRIVYGSDMIISKSKDSKRRAWLSGRMMCDLSLHQEKDYRCPTINKGTYALLPGFDFDDAILRKIYIENPERFLKRERPRIRIQAK